MVILFYSVISTKWNAWRNPLRRSSTTPLPSFYSLYSPSTLLSYYTRFTFLQRFSIIYTQRTLFPPKVLLSLRLVYPLYSPTTSLSHYTPFILVPFNELPHFHYSLTLLTIRPLSPPLISLSPLFLSLSFLFIVVIICYICAFVLFFLPQVRGSLDYARDDGTQ